MIIIENIKLFNGNSMEILKELPDNSVDSIVTDPPYELGFMGKSWDSTGIVYNVELWKECLRVLKHGGHLLAFGGTRTYHRMACAIEDAGFEIRDQIQWIYGSGFPKSMDISKQIDKKAGVEREVLGEYKHPIAKNGDRTGNKSPYQANNSHLEGSYKITVPTTEDAIKWGGWGTALKPANEPICLARKPISEKTIADNVIKWGTGGINIDDCRVPFGSNENYLDLARSSQGFTSKSEIYHNNKEKYKISSEGGNQQGRFPANVILDEDAAELLDKQSGTSKSRKGKQRTAEINNMTKLNNSKETQVNCEYNDEGGVSRFFYCAKASSSERNKGLDDKANIHPTVKPIKLMEYLIKLVTPSNGIVLDPFMGSGTTGIACKNLDRGFIGIELENTYFNIAENRIKAS